MTDDNDNDNEDKENNRYTIIGELENVHKFPPEPIYAPDLLDKLVIMIPPEAAVDINMAMNSDCENVIVRRGLLKVIIDVANNVPDFDIRTMGAISELQENIDAFDHYKNKLKEDREKGRHW